MTKKDFQPIGSVSDGQWQMWREGVPLKCTHIIDETADVKTFTLQAEPQFVFKYHPGQYITLDLVIDGSRVFRSYTLSSSPARPHAITITVKRIPSTQSFAPGLVSNWLHDNLSVGDELTATGPFGDFSNIDFPSSKLCLISGGSGITPMLSMIRWITDTHSHVDIICINYAKTSDDLIAEVELQQLQKQHSNFKLYHHFTREGETKYFDLDSVRQYVKDITERKIFVCGPERLMQEVERQLTSSHFDMQNFHRESFTGRTKTDNETIPTPVPKSSSSSVNIAESEIKFVRSGVTVNAGNTTVLEAAESAGLSLPYGCRAGACGACQQKMLKGEVQTDYGSVALTDEDQQEGYILCCVCVVKGDVEIDA